MKLGQTLDNYIYKRKLTSSIAYLCSFRELTRNSMVSSGPVTIGRERSSRFSRSTIFSRSLSKGSRLQQNDFFATITFFGSENQIMIKGHPLFCGDRIRSLSLNFDIEIKSFSQSNLQSSLKYWDHLNSSLIY